MSNIRKLTSLDVDQCARYAFDEDNAAQRVILVGGENLTINAEVKDSSQFKTVEVPVIVKETQFRDIPQIIIQKEIERVEIPTIVKETQYKDVPVIVKEVEFRNIPQIIKEVEFKEIQVPVVIKEIEYREIEKPIVIKEIEYKEIIKEVFIEVPKIEVVTIEKPVIVTEYRDVHIPFIVEKYKSLPMIVKICIGLQTLAMLGLLIKH